MNKLWQSALAEAADALALELYEFNVILTPAQKMLVARKTVQAYLSARTLEVAKPRMIAETIALSEMKVGDIRWFAYECTKAVWYCRMKRARTLLEEPSARWAMHVSKTQVRITRLEDGAANPGRDPWTNAKAVFLSSLKIGEEKFSKDFPDRTHLGASVKLTARKILGNPNAEWSGRAVKGGVWITRKPDMEI